MKWLPINGKKSPEFGKIYVLLDDNENWFKGHLREITENDAGKSYLFHNSEKGESVNNIEYFMEVTVPKP